MTVEWLTILAALSAGAWVYLWLFRGDFWAADQLLPDDIAAPSLNENEWPGISIVIPARDEAEDIGNTIAALAAQKYRGDFHIFLVDDNSSDDTADIARAASEDPAALTIINGQPLAEGWTGKLWAVNQGLEEAGRSRPDDRYVLLTDADIEHDPDSLTRLVIKAEADGLDMVSLMVQLRCESFWEHLLIPAFVFFFQKLYPFPQVNDPRHPMAAAAGGCMLVRREALQRAGGISQIRDKIIDDCALGALLKGGGRIWLGLTSKVHSRRRYDNLGEIWRMVTRTAFVQLNHSTVALVGTVLGLAIIYGAPPVAAIWGTSGGAVMLGTGAWLAMAFAFLPTLRLYSLPPATTFALAAALPLSALIYGLMTIDSARRHWQGQSGMWKGRDYNALHKK